MICQNVAAETIRWGARQRVTVPAGGTSDVAQFVDMSLPYPTVVLISVYGVLAAGTWDVQITLRLRMGLGSANWEEITTLYPGPQPYISDLLFRPLRTLQVSATAMSTATVDRTLDLAVMAAPWCGPGFVGLASP
jgi:hypothetical protein